jgi:hypothetical protein
MVVRHHPRMSHRQPTLLMRTCQRTLFLALYLWGQWQ